MKALNLPRYKINLRETQKGTQIFDVVRKKYVMLTPEEWVRQHTVHYLINHKNVPRSLIKVETGVSYNKLHKRSDIIVYARNGTPFILIECKSFDQGINKSALHQVAAYNKTLSATYVVITNGMKFLCASLLPTMSWIDDIPTYPSLKD